MVASLQAGYIFGATEQVTNAKLAALINNGTVSGIDQTNLGSNEGLVHTGTAAPTDTDQIWVDTSSTPTIVRFYNSNLSQWVPSSELALMTNRAGQTGSAGRVVILDTSNANSYKYTGMAGDTSFLGIEMASTTNTSTGPICSQALGITINLELSASAGCYLRTSTATGKAEPCASNGSGIFAFLTEPGTASARARLLGIMPNVSAASASAASQAEMEAATNTSNPVTPFSMKYHPSMPKMWGVFDATAAGTHGFLTSFGLTNVVKVNTGLYRINMATAFSGDYGVIITGQAIGADVAAGQVSSAAKSASAVEITIKQNEGLNYDVPSVTILLYGDFA